MSIDLQEQWEGAPSQESMARFRDPRRVMYVQDVCRKRLKRRCDGLGRRWLDNAKLKAKYDHERLQFDIEDRTTRDGTESEKEQVKMLSDNLAHAVKQSIFAANDKDGIQDVYTLMHAFIDRCVAHLASYPDKMDFMPLDHVEVQRSETDQIVEARARKVEDEWHEFTRRERKIQSRSERRGESGSVNGSTQEPLENNEARKALITWISQYTEKCGYENFSEAGFRQWYVDRMDGLPPVKLHDDEITHELLQTRRGIDEFVEFCASITKKGISDRQIVLTAAEARFRYGNQELNAVLIASIDRAIDFEKLRRLRQDSPSTRRPMHRH